MNQSALIGGALIAGFVLFLARQNRLSAYAGVFFGDKPATHSTTASPATTAGGITLPSYSDIQTTLSDLGVPRLPGLDNNGWGSILNGFGG